MNTTGVVRAYLLLSFAAGAMAAVVAVAGGGEDAGVDATERAIVALGLSAVAALGVSMALRPNWRRDLPPGRHTAGGEGREAPGGPPGPPRRGHHPDCQRFSRHTLVWRGRVLCAGCTGLAVGGALVVCLAVAYAVAAPDTPGETGPFLVAAGLVLVTVELFSAAAGLSAPRASAVLNALMVLGFALVSIGMLEATGEAAWGLVGVLLSVLWMDCRAQLSRRNHASTCAVCPEGCPAYFL